MLQRVKIKKMAASKPKNLRSSARRDLDFLTFSNVTVPTPFTLSKYALGCKLLQLDSEGEQILGNRKN